MVGVVLCGGCCDRCCVIGVWRVLCCVAGVDRCVVCVVWQVCGRCCVVGIVLCGGCCVVGVDRCCVACVVWYVLCGGCCCVAGVDRCCVACVVWRVLCCVVYGVAGVDRCCVAGVAVWRVLCGRCCEMCVYTDIQVPALPVRGPTAMSMSSTQDLLSKYQPLRKEPGLLGAAADCRVAQGAQERPAHLLAPESKEGLKSAGALRRSQHEGAV